MDGTMDLDLPPLDDSLGMRGPSPMRQDYFNGPDISGGKGSDTSDSDRLAVAAGPAPTLGAPSELPPLDEQKPFDWGANSQHQQRPPPSQQNPGPGGEPGPSDPAPSDQQQPQQQPAGFPSDPTSAQPGPHPSNGPGMPPPAQGPLNPQQQQQQRPGPGGSTAGPRTPTPADVQRIQNMIESCIQYHLSRDETIDFICRQMRVDPRVTALLWRKLEEENTTFFHHYNVRMKVKEQMLLFNYFLEHQVQAQRRWMWLKQQQAQQAQAQQQQQAHQQPQGPGPSGGAAARNSKPMGSAGGAAASDRTADLARRQSSRQQASAPAAPGGANNSGSAAAQARAAAAKANAAAPRSPLGTGMHGGIQAGSTVTSSGRRSGPPPRLADATLIGRPPRSASGRNLVGSGNGSGAASSPLNMFQDGEDSLGIGSDNPAGLSPNFHDLDLSSFALPNGSPLLAPELSPNLGPVADAGTEGQAVAGAPGVPRSFSFLDLNQELSNLDADLGAGKDGGAGGMPRTFSLSDMGADLGGLDVDEF